MALYQKLGIESDHYAAVVNPPANYFELLEGVIEQQKELEGLHKGRFDVIHYFVDDNKAFFYLFLQCFCFSFKIVILLLILPIRSTSLYIPSYNCKS